MKIKRTTKIIVSFLLVVSICLFNLTAFAGVFVDSIPDPPQSSDTNAGLLLYCNSNSKYYYCDVGFPFKSSVMRIASDGSLTFRQSSSLTLLSFNYYCLDGGEWTLVGRYTSLGSGYFPDAYTIVKSTNDVYMDGSGVFFQQADSRALEQMLVTTQGLMSPLMTTFRGIVVWLIVFVVGLIAFWKAWHFLKTNLFRA